MEMAVRVGAGVGGGNCGRKAHHVLFSRLGCVVYSMHSNRSTRLGSKVCSTMEVVCATAVWLLVSALPVQPCSYHPNTIDSNTVLLVTHVACCLPCCCQLPQ